MKLIDCNKEIRDRKYLLGTELQHQSGTHKIKIASLDAVAVAEPGFIIFAATTTSKMNRELVEAR